MRLEEFFRVNKKAALAFSGGADSAYLLYAAKSFGADIAPYYAKTEFQPRFEYEDAKRLCRELGVKLRTVQYSILSDKTVALNPADRCYYCKKALFSALKKAASSDGCELLLDGTNASDNALDRPGMKAVTELGVRSPLKECNLTKEEIRALSKQAGLFTWDKPAYSCLAARVPSGHAISGALLKKIEAAEEELFKMGFSDFRVRVYGEAARIQLKSGQFIRAAERREEIAERIKPYFDTVLMDTQTR